MLKRLNIKIIAILGVLLLPVLALVGFLFHFNGRIYPNVAVGGVNVGGLTVNEAETKLTNAFNIPEEITIESDSVENSRHVIPTQAVGVSLNTQESISKAYNWGRGGNIKDDIQQVVSTILNGKNFPSTVDIDHDALTQQLSVYAEAVTDRPVLPRVYLENGEIVVTPGESGTELNIKKLTDEIVNKLQNGETPTVHANILPVTFALSEGDLMLAKLRANKLINKNFTLEFEFEKFTFTPDKLVSFVNPQGGYAEDTLLSEVEIISSRINRDAQNPVFTFTEGKVQEFKAAKEGIVVNEEKLLVLMRDVLEDLENEEFESTTYAIPVDSSSPTVTTEEVNSLGIKELIGRGTSTFRGSIPSRVYNIQLASSRLNGVLIKPGEEFSFNGALGDVSALTGYKQAYVIQGGRTVLGDGGGVCQVSTTFFRSALQAGLPILERNPHSYRVGYYEQDSGPGLDASIYTPTLDLKIKNDTPGHILIQTIVDTTNSSLVFELYGTSDGRVATVGKPVVTNQSAPPEPLYIDDPEKPTGYIEQIDYAAWGAKAQFDYKVERDGETLIEKTFFSNYRPWQAKFIRGTGPAL